MKYLPAILLGILFSFVLEDNRQIENLLEDTNWRVSQHAFADVSQEKYILTAKEDADWIWGSFVDFQKNTFSGHYSAPCGNDCFVSTSGEYKFVNEHTIFVDVQTISRSGFCSDAGVDSIGFKAYYSLTSNENGYVLIKTKKP